MCHNTGKGLTGSEGWGLKVANIASIEKIDCSCQLSINRKSLLLRSIPGSLVLTASFSKYNMEFQPLDTCTHAHTQMTSCSAIWSLAGVNLRPTGQSCCRIKFPSGVPRAQGSRGFPFQTSFILLTPDEDRYLRRNMNYY